MRLLSCFFLLILFILFSCNSRVDSSRVVELEQQNYSEKELQKELIKANIYEIRLEDKQIDSFLERYGWEMKKSGTGLRYNIYKKGNGEKAQNGKLAYLKYSVKLINGEEVYSSDKQGIKSFRIGSGGVERGLEEGILLLKVGDKAKFVIPSHLAFGLLGDEDKIPAKSTLIYDIEFIDIK